MRAARYNNGGSETPQIKGGCKESGPLDLRLIGHCLNKGRSRQGGGENEIGLE